MVFETIFTVALSLFSLFGIYCFIRIMASKLASIHYPAAIYVEWDSKIEDVMLDVIAARQSCLCGKCGVIVLINGENPEVKRELDREGIPYIYIKQEI